MRTRVKEGFVPVGRFTYATQTTYKRKTVYDPWYFSTATPCVYDPSDAYRRSNYKRTTDELHKGPPYVIGGPFDSHYLSGGPYELGPSIPFAEAMSTNGLWKWVYTGFASVITYNPHQLPSIIGTRPDVLKAKIDSELGDVYSHGEEAYTKFSPLKPHVDLGQTLAEIGELPRMLRTSARTFRDMWRYAKKKYRERDFKYISPNYKGKRAKLKPRTFANEWLNNQFGWVPFLSTLYDLCTTINRTQDIVKRLRTYNGKWEKRGGRVFAEERSDQIYYGPGYQYQTGINSAFLTKNRTTIQRITGINCWFTAKYRYWIPSLLPGRIPADVLAQIYGVRITPELLWNIMPWSWMIDWFTNIRGILQAADERKFGQLVTKDAYLMGHRSIIDHVHCTSQLGTAAATRDLMYINESKQRFASTPYGFGVHLTDLSPWKVSILAALGLSKATFS